MCWPETELGGLAGVPWASGSYDAPFVFEIMRVERRRRLVLVT